MKVFSFWRYTLSTIIGSWHIKSTEHYQAHKDFITLRGVLGLIVTPQNSSTTQHRSLITEFWTFLAHFRCHPSLTHHGYWWFWVMVVAAHEVSILTLKFLGRWKDDDLHVLYDTLAGDIWLFESLTLQLTQFGRADDINSLDIGWWCIGFLAPVIWRYEILCSILLYACVNFDQGLSRRKWQQYWNILMHQVKNHAGTPTEDLVLVMATFKARYC